MWFEVYGYVVEGLRCINSTVSSGLTLSNVILFILRFRVESFGLKVEGSRFRV